jgi:tetrahydromethanopterin S-methyltransferase subunit G
MSDDRKIDEILEIVKTERGLNNSRFVQLSTGLHELRQEVNRRMDKLETEINKVHTSLSQDIQAFGEDLYKLKRRVDKIERKIA